MPQNRVSDNIMHVTLNTINDVICSWLKVDHWHMSSNPTLYVLEGEKESLQKFKSFDLLREYTKLILKVFLT